MDGFPPSLDLNGLPRKCIISPVNHQRNQYSRGPQVIYDVRSVMGSSLHFKGLTPTSQKCRSGFVKGRVQGGHSDTGCERSDRLASPHPIPLASRR